MASLQNTYNNTHRIEQIHFFDARLRCGALWTIQFLDFAIVLVYGPAFFAPSMVLWVQFAKDSLSGNLCVRARFHPPSRWIIFIVDILIRCPIHYANWAEWNCCWAETAFHWNSIIHHRVCISSRDILISGQMKCMALAAWGQRLQRNWFVTKQLLYWHLKRR